jgi:hypothetical protein
LISRKEWLPEPQRWNRYTYGLNNPLKYIDPDGKDAIAAFLFGPQYRDVNTFDLLFGGEAKADYKRAWNNFLDDHRTLTHGLSPFPTSKLDVGMQMVLPGGGKIVEPALESTIGKAIAKRGLTVLGKVGRYEIVADALKANSFQILPEVWAKMTTAEKWAANQEFLDSMIMRGDEIVFSDPVKNINDVSGAFRKEIEYLLQKGYKLNDDGFGMTKLGD